MVNQPPDPGVCFVTPPAGVTKQDRFSLECRDWEDDQGIVNYIVTGLNSCVRFFGRTVTLPKNIYSAKKRFTTILESTGIHHNVESKYFTVIVHSLKID